VLAAFVDMGEMLKRSGRIGEKAQRDICVFSWSAPGSKTRITNSLERLPMILRRRSLGTSNQKIT
jgi:hypothetical protein